MALRLGSFECYFGLNLGYFLTKVFFPVNKCWLEKSTIQTNICIPIITFSLTGRIPVSKEVLGAGAGDANFVSDRLVLTGLDSLTRRDGVSSGMALTIGKGLVVEVRLGGTGALRFFPPEFIELEQHHHHQF